MLGLEQDYQKIGGWSKVVQLKKLQVLQEQARQVSLTGVRHLALGTDENYTYIQRASFMTLHLLD